MSNTTFNGNIIGTASVAVSLADGLPPSFTEVSITTTTGSVYNITNTDVNKKLRTETTTARTGSIIFESSNTQNIPTGSQIKVFSYGQSTLLGSSGAIDFRFKLPDFTTLTSVDSVAVQADGKILIGGTFTSASGISSASYLIRVDSTGSLDTTFYPVPSNTVSEILIQPDNKILIAGSFATVSGSTRNALARLNSDGTLDSTFGNPNITGNINDIKLQSDGKIIIGGQFTLVGGVTRNRIARLLTSSAYDTSFLIGDGFNGQVNSIAIQSDGKILAGGNFSTYSGSSRSNFARLNNDGTLDTTFNVTVNSTVDAVAVQSNGDILVGGNFTAVSGSNINRLVRLNSSGILDSTFNPNPLGGTVSLILTESNNNILVGGGFTSFNSGLINRVARLNVSGAVDFSFNPNPNTNPTSFAKTADGKVIITNPTIFNTVGGRARVALIFDSGSDVIYSPYDGGTYIKQYGSVTLEKTGTNEFTIVESNVS